MDVRWDPIQVNRVFGINFEDEGTAITCKNWPSNSNKLSRGQVILEALVGGNTALAMLL